MRRNGSRERRDQRDYKDSKGIKKETMELNEYE